MLFGAAVATSVRVQGLNVERDEVIKLQPFHKDFMGWFVVLLRLSIICMSM